MPCWGAYNKTGKSTTRLRPGTGKIGTGIMGQIGELRGTFWRSKNGN